MTTYSEMLTSLRALRIDAGIRRDGTALSRIETVISVLDAMADASRNLSSKRHQRISGERDAARAMVPFCKAHDKAARGELSPAEYSAALEALRGARTQSA